MKTTIEMGEYTGQDIDGDWDVRFYFEDYAILTGVGASSGEQAIRFAEDKLPHNLSKCEEVTATLVGIYGGY